MGYSQRYFQCRTMHYLLATCALQSLGDARETADNKAFLAEARTFGRLARDALEQARKSWDEGQKMFGLNEPMPRNYELPEFDYESAQTQMRFTKAGNPHFWM